MCTVQIEVRVVPSQDVESHIKLRHRVSLASIIMESDTLPTRELLVTLQCGVCERQFVGQVEQVLTNHIETTHGKYYVGLGLEKLAQDLQDLRRVG